MKNISLIIIQVLVVATTALSQWVDKSISTNNDLTSVDFFDNEIGYVSSLNLIFETSNGGDSWQIAYESNNPIVLEDVFVINENTIIAVGQDLEERRSLIIKSSDNGNTWTQNLLDNTSILRSVFFTSDSIGYGSGGNGTMIKTIDGGDTWIELQTGTNSTLTSVFFVNDNMGIAVGGEPFKSEIIKTEDGGNSWQTIESPSTNFLQSVYFTDLQVGYAVGWEGEIMKTEDCGNTWVFQNSVSMGGNLEITFTDSVTGYITGGTEANESPEIQKTDNAGQTWEDISPSGTDALISINFPSEAIGYAVGVNGSVYKTDSEGTTSVINLPNSNETISVFPNPTSGILNIKSENNDPIERITIYDSNGRIIQKINQYSENPEIDLSNFETNIYYLEISTDITKELKRIVKN